MDTRRKRRRLKQHEVLKVIRTPIQLRPFPEANDYKPIRLRTIFTKLPVLRSKIVQKAQANRSAREIKSAQYKYLKRIAKEKAERRQAALA